MSKIAQLLVTQRLGNKVVIAPRRTRDHTRTVLGKEFLDNNLEKIATGSILHWDSKHLKSLTHTGSSEERVAIIIEHNGEEVLLG